MSEIFDAEDFDVEDIKDMLNETYESLPEKKELEKLVGSYFRVLSTVATCTRTVNAMFCSPSIPNSDEAIARCPLLLMGRYSVSP